MLITLGIIGVVAAMTLPSLITNYQKKQAVTQLKKAYSVLEQTIKMAEKDYGPINDWPEWDTSGYDVLNKYFKPYLSGTITYQPNSDWGKGMCYDVTSKSHSNNSYSAYQYNWFGSVHISTPFIANNTSSIKLTDGSCIGINDNNAGSYYQKRIFIDINGSQTRPNTAGKDLFFFYINKQGFIKPSGDDWTIENLKSTNSNACNQQAYLGGYVCAARIMAEGWEINYWNN